MRRRLPRGSGSLAAAFLLALAAQAQVAGPLWHLLGGKSLTPFPAERLLGLAVLHLTLALAAVAAAAVAGIGLGIAVTRPAGRGLRPLADTLVAAAQAVPPVVVVALAFPVLGFGAAPTALALVLYCVMPILRGTVGAIESVPPDALESATAMGLTRTQRLRDVELPLAAPAILDGVRVALVLGVATAAVGALAGARTLGTPIVLGLQNQNELYILQGAAATAALAFLAEGLLMMVLGRPTLRDGPGIARQTSES